MPSLYFFRHLVHIAIEGVAGYAFDGDADNLLETNTKLT